MRNPFLLLGLLLSVSVQAQNVGIGTTTPTRQLDVNGDLRVRGLAGTANGRPLVSDSAGNIVATRVENFGLQSIHQPTLQSAITTGNGPHGIVVNGHLAYVINRSSRSLQVIDYSDLVVPSVLSSVNLASEPTGIAHSQSSVYIISQPGNSLLVFDCSNPAAPVLRSTVAVANPQAITATSTFVHIGTMTGSSGIHTYDCSSMDNPLYKGRSLLPPTTLGRCYITALDNQVFIVYPVNGGVQYDRFSARASGLNFENSTMISNTTNPLALAVATDIACFSTQNTLYYFPTDLSNSLQAVGLPTSRTIQNLTAHADRIYATVADSNLVRVYEANKLAALRPIYSLHTGHTPGATAANGNRVYVTNPIQNAVQLFMPPSLLLQNADGSMGSTPLTSFVDNLGNHTATRHLNLNGNRLVGGGPFGISINTQGHVGIVTANPLYTLDVAGRMRVQSGGGSAGIWLMNGNNTANRAFVGMRDDNTVGIHLGNDPNERNWRFLQNVNNATMAINGEPDSRYILTVYGSIAHQGAVTISDARYKQNIQPHSSPLPTLLQLNGKTYEWNRQAFPDMHFDSTVQMGFIAQEVEKVLPQLVTTDSKGYKAVNYMQVIPLLTEAMKEQQKEIESLKQQMAEIRTLLQGER